MHVLVGLWVKILCKDVQLRFQIDANRHVCYLQVSDMRSNLLKLDASPT